MSEIFLFWSLQPKRVAMSQLEEGHSQCSVDLPHHIVDHSVLKNKFVADCSWLPFLELHNLGIRPRGQIIQS